MYIKYELYRAKNQELFNAEKIEWVIETDKDLIEIDRRILEVLTYHISTLPQIKKFGTAYLGRTKIVGIEINDNDNLGGITEQQFRDYMHSETIDARIIGVDIQWNKKDDIEIKENTNV